MIIKGKNINLRPIELSDASRFIKWSRDPEVAKLVGNGHLLLKDEIVWIRNLSKKKERNLHFAIETKGHIHIGGVGFHDLNKRDKYAVFGINIGDKKYWNRGYGTEATKMIIDYGFKKLKFHRIELEVYDFNLRAIKVYKRLGFKFEGRKRERVFYKGKFYDSFVMGILND